MRISQREIRVRCKTSAIIFNRNLPDKNLNEITTAGKERVGDCVMKLI